MIRWSVGMVYRRRIYFTNTQKADIWDRRHHHDRHHHRDRHHHHDRHRGSRVSCLTLSLCLRQENVIGRLLVL